jgi:hypothetical protein
MQFLPKEKINYTSVRLVFILFTILLIIPSCKSEKSDLLLNEIDTQALDNIRNISGWNFFQQEVKMQIFEGGILRFTITGFASHKSDRNAKQLLIPLMLLHELPSFVDKPMIGEKDQADLLMYQTKSGMWLLVAQIYDTEVESISISRVGEREKSIASLVVNLLISSENYRTHAPVVVPAGQGQSIVEVKIEGTKDSKLLSNTINVVSSDSRILVPLTKIPPAVSKDVTQAAAKLPITMSSAWDFRGLEYSFTSRSSSSVFRIHYILITALCSIALILLGIYYQVIFGLRLFHEFPRPSNQTTSTPEQTTSTPEQTTSTPNTPTLVEIRKRYEERVISEADKYAHQLQSGDNQGGIQETLGVIQQLLSILKGIEREHRIVRVYAILPALVVLFIIIAVLIILLLYPTTAQADTTNQPIQDYVIPGNIRLELSPSLKENGKLETGIIIKFVPLAVSSAAFGSSDQPHIVNECHNNSDPKSRVTNFAIRVISNSNYDYQNFKIDPSISNVDLKAIMKPKWTDFCFKVPAKRSEKLETYLSLRFDITRVRLDSLIKDFQKAELISITGAVSKKLPRNNLLHPFPFDKISIEVPINFELAAFLDQILINEPRGFNAKAHVDPSSKLPVLNGLKEESNSGIYILREPIGENSFLYPNPEIVVKASFSRLFEQQLFLVLAPFACAFLGGIGISWLWLSSKPERTILRAICNTIGLPLVAALPVVMRSNAMANHKELPNIGAGEGITIFDIITLASWAVLVSITIISYRYYKNKRGSSNSPPS